MILQFLFNNWRSQLLFSIFFSASPVSAAYVTPRKVKKQSRK